MDRTTDTLLTAAAPVAWGSTYLITTELLPPGYPVTVSLLRALPAGLLLLAVSRQLPTGRWWGRALVLGALNFTVFWIALFIAAYRLPGGVAATVGAVQPMLVLGLAWLWLDERIHPIQLLAAVMGLFGVALLVLAPDATLDPIGVAAALGGAVSMAAGVVLTRRWKPSVPLLTMTAWQLTAGGLLLLPLAWWLEPPLPPLTVPNGLGLAFLSLVGAAGSYLLWFRGIARLGPTRVSQLGLLSPVTAMLLGWVVLGQGLGPVQILGAALVLASIKASRVSPPTASIRPLPTGALP